jgi:hypothetical protein
MKASRAKASKQTGKSATKQAYAPTQSPAPAAAAPESRQPALKLPVQDSSASIAERLQAERKQIFKPISIVECCKNATATLLEVNDSEYMILAARSHHHGDELRAAVHRAPQDQFESCVRRAGCRNQGGRREDLAGDLHALRLRLLRSRDRARRMRAESVRGAGVIHVSGIKR